jgi:uncharacterized membrane protein YdbT with pleckstrin-like domain
MVYQVNIEKGQGVWYSISGELITAIVIEVVLFFLRGIAPAGVMTMGIDVVILVIAVAYGIGIFSKWAVINSLEYFVDIENSKLVDKHKFLSRTINSARLQVVNDVNMNQSFWQRVFGISTVEVSYGFGDMGYQFYFNYLSPDEAEKVMDMIKPSGKVFGRTILP